MTEEERSHNGWNDPGIGRPWPYGALRDGGLPRRPFSVVGYWLPAVLFAAVIGGLSLVIARSTGEIGWATLGIPVAIGAFFGYGVPFRHALWTTWFAMVAYVGSASFMAAAGFGELFCAILLSLLGLPLVALGAGIGVWFRYAIRDSRYYWGRFLPLILAVVLGGPGAALEARLTPPNPVEEVMTSRVVHAPADAIWSARLFGDDVHAEPPGLHHVGLKTPERNAGHASLVGDVKTIPLGDGVVRLRVTRADAPLLLEYEVIEQRGFEDRTARLVGGTIRLTPLDGDRTRVTISTRYEPLLGARAVWGPIERFVAEELHDQVLRETRRAALLAGESPAANESDALDQ